MKAEVPTDAETRATGRLVGSGPATGLPSVGDTMTPRKKPGKKPGELVAQPHGGKLRNGSLPGTNKGGWGRPPNELRGTLREILERGLPVLEGYVEGRVPVKMVGKCEKCGHEHEDYELLPTDLVMLQTVKATDRLRALEIAARYGGVAELALTADEQPEDEMTPERRLAIWEAIKRIKNIDELEKMMVASAEEQAATQQGG